MLLDNKKTGKVGDALKENLGNNATLSIISCLFSIYGFSALQKELDKVDSVRLLFSESLTAIDGSPPPLIQGLSGDKFERRFQNKLTQTKIARECAVWLNEKTEIKAVITPHILNQNLFHIQNTENATAIQGSSPFTTSGLGYSESDNYAMNMCLTDSDSTKGLLEWFDSIWNDKNAVLEITVLCWSRLSLPLLARKRRKGLKVSSVGEVPFFPKRPFKELRILKSSAISFLIGVPDDRFF